ncbi:hypothetical protein GGR45_002399 [Sphingomonas zeae]|jgi:hypothetical protein|nr:hypothetical protein [Sphingomonas zeae]
MGWNKGASGWLVAKALPHPLPLAGGERPEVSEESQNWPNNAPLPQAGGDGGGKAASYVLTDFPSYANSTIASTSTAAPSGSTGTPTAERA